MSDKDDLMAVALRLKKSDPCKNRGRLFVTRVGGEAKAFRLKSSVARHGDKQSGQISYVVLSDD